MGIATKISMAQFDGSSDFLAALSMTAAGVAMGQWFGLLV